MSGTKSSITRVGRVTKPTPKMEALLKDMSQGKTAKERTTLLDKAKAVERLISLEPMPEEDIQGKLQDLEHDITALTVLEKTEIEGLTEEEKQMYLETFGEENAIIKGTADIIREHISQEGVKSTDSISQVGTNVSASTVVSSASQQQAWIDERNRQAELMNERVKLIHQEQIDQERIRIEELHRKLKQKENMLRLERELELSKAKMEIMAQAAGRTNSGVSRNSKRTRKKMTAAPSPKKIKTDQRVPTSSPHKRYVTPNFKDVKQPHQKEAVDEADTHGSGLGNIEDVFGKLAAAIDRNSRQTVQIEPQVFTGDILGYALWRRNFEELVERDVKLERRFIYLLKYTQGPAKECIEHLTHLDNCDAYQEGMKLLEERYGDKFSSYEALRNKLDQWPTVKDGDGMALRKLTDFLSTCVCAMYGNPSLRILDTMPENHKILQKLPKRIVERWSTKVDEWQYGSRSDENTREYPPFVIFVEFLKKQARIELGPVKRMLNRNEGNSVKQVRVHLTDIDEQEEVACYRTNAEAVDTGGCRCCQGNHETQYCPKFVSMTVKERLQMSYDKRLCRGCLLPGHFAWECKQIQRCDSCQGRHHRLFHDDAYKPRHRHTKPREEETKEETKVQKTVLTTRVDDDNVTAHIVLVHLGVGRGKTQQVYCVVDNQSNACFVSQAVANQIGAVGKKTQVELHTMAGVEDVELDKVERLQVIDKAGTVCIALPPTYIKDGMETSHEQIPEPEQIKKWKHLATIAKEFEDVNPKIPIGLLVGRNCFRGTKLVDFIPSQGSEPYAVKTELGWGIVGRMEPRSQGESSTVWVHTTSAVEPSPAKMFESCSVDFNDQYAEGKMSQDDIKFIKCLEEGLVIKEDGHMMLPLPLKHRNPIPDNSKQALGSLRSLKKRFDRDEEYKKKFVAKMQELFDKGYAEPAPEDSAPGRTWHLTFHGVFHPKKIDELRVVFNGKRKFLGFILNEILLQGPDQINSLIGVFCRFRKETVTLMCDIEAMFYQVQVIPEDRDYLRFYWYPDGDTEAEPKEYRMMVHIFGATSSPGVANYALNKVAELHEEKYGQETTKFIKEGFYVDDGVTAVNDDSKAVNLMKSSRGMCAEGGFNLTKFSSNSKAVLEQIPVEIRAKNLRELSLARDMLPQGFTLGIFLCNEEDCIKFQVKLAPMPRTRRGILSTTSQVYDPLGLISPFILEGRRILKELCKDGLGWDEPIKDELLKKWDEWLNQLKELEDIKFPRCYGSRGVEAAVRKELHHFADASLSGYGECSYLRLVYEDGTAESSLVIAKSKVLPKQSVTVPRLELAAAVLAVRMARFLQEQMKLEDVTHHYWSDSKVVLGYINNDSKRFHVYVANRVANIREFSVPQQWHHVETQINPADIASRGATVEELKTSALWRLGPEFLRTGDGNWSQEEVQLDEEDPEIKKVSVYDTEVIEEVVNWEKKFEHFSTWKSLTRGIAKLTQMTKFRTQSAAENTLTLQERQESETFIIQKMQAHYFKKELIALQAMKEDPNRTLPSVLKNGRLRKLDPFLDDSNIIRVGGRFKRGPWSYHLKHPIILPGSDHVSGLLVSHVHQLVAHSGREATMSALRASGYWILAVRRRIDSMIWRCTVCIRFRGQACKQKMGEVPTDRLEEVPPFTHVGVDYFGPYTITQRRAKVKRYIVIYTCLVTRATHLDKAYAMGSDEFINSYRRFVARRGAVRTIRCDRGTNFVGAREDLELNLKDVIDARVKQAFIESNCTFVEFKLNPPAASHMGGVWERPVGTGKRILNVLLHEHGKALDDDLMDTVLAETEGIMNGMPLTTVDVSGADSMKPLTAAMLLTMKPSIAPPPLHKFDQADLYSKRRWRRAQHVVNEFWKRWRLELLPTWQQRKKWTDQMPNLEVDDVVLMMDDNLPRMTWPLGRVVETKAGDDGLVRSVKICTAKSTYTRPIHKLMLLVKRSIPVMGAD